MRPHTNEGWPAARRWLVRYLSEGTPGLDECREVTASLAKHNQRRP
jgi:hypothetical protein